MADNAGMPSHAWNADALRPAVRDPACARMLAVLLTGQGRTAAELARSGAMQSAAATGWLAGLRDARLVSERMSGGRIYYFLADGAAAAALRAAGIGPQDDQTERRWQRPGWRTLRRARSCHGHLAGELGVLLLQSLLRRGGLEPAGEGFTLTSSGQACLSRWGVHISDSNAPAAPRCLDWSERRDHLGGGLGKAVLEALRERGWLSTGPVERSLHLTASGRRQLLPWLQH